MRLLSSSSQTGQGCQEDNALWLGRRFADKGSEVHCMCKRASAEALDTMPRLCYWCAPVSGGGVPRVFVLSFCDVDRKTSPTSGGRDR